MITSTALPLQSAAAAPSILGHTLLLVGILPGLDTSIYGTPYDVQSTISASTVFGNGLLTRAIGEAFRQGAPRVFAVALSDESNISSFFDQVTDLLFDICVPVGLAGTPDRYQTFATIAYQREQYCVPFLTVFETDITHGSAVSVLTSNIPSTAAGTIQVPGSPNPLVLSRYFMSVPDQIIVNPNIPSQYQTSAATSIAAAMAKNGPQGNITNKPLQGVQLVGGYSTSDALTLANNGYTTLRNSARRGLVVNYGVTATSSIVGSINYSPSFHNAGTVQTVHYVVSSLQQAGANLIGNTSSQNINSVIQSTLDTLKNTGIINDASYQLSINQLVGAVYITLDLVVPNETQKISVQSQLTLIRT